MGHNTHIKSLSFSLIFFLLHLCTFTCESRPPFACEPSNPTTRNLPFCQVSLHIRDRVNDLVGRLTLQEKIRSLVNNAAPIDRLGIKGYEWWSEALHGVSDTGPGVHFGGEFPGATGFPQVITTAASFNASLWEAIGEAVSNEGRAMYNGGSAGLTYWSPNVNIFRDPRWGRGQETPGEDPMLTARYAARYVRGLQGDGRGNKLKVAACCKHFTAYDLDNWNGLDRFHFNAEVSKQDLEETYNVPFKGCVLDGKVASVMCSYNQVNGKPTCADPSILRDIIRGQWHLNGYIVSDCDSVEVMFNEQHFTTTPEDAVADSIKAGLDLDCGPYLALYTEGAVRARKLNEADVNRAFSNILTVQMRLGMFDGPRQPYNYLGPKDVCTPAHQELAVEAARQGIVLLKNINRALPLSTNRCKNVAVIGPNSDATTTMIGNYAGKPCAYTSPLQGISRYAKTIHQLGCTDVSCTSNQQFGAAEVAARHADATILVMGIDQSIEREGFDRSGLLLPGHQQELVSRVAKASRGPIVLVLMSGGPIDVTFAKTDPKISAILWTGYPGQAGGAAIAEILFGQTNPGGKLPMTWYPQDYVAKVPMSNMAMHDDPSKGYPGRTYRFYKGPIVFPFGYGLSYTSFRHTLVNGPTKISVPFTNPKAFKNNTLLNAIKVSNTNCESLSFGLHIEVENIGDMDGTHTVMIYASNSGVGAEKHLVAFEKIHVLAGTKQSIGVNIDACKHLSIVDQFGIRRIPIGEHHLHIGDELKHTIFLQNSMAEIRS